MCQLGTGDFLDHPLPTAVVGLSSGTQQVTLGEDFGLRYRVRIRTGSVLLG